MPRISRIHFAVIGHRDARFPALTLDFRGPDGEPVDSVIWAENGTGKSSLFTLFFSTYQTNRRQFLGARGVAKARELEDYVGERDLSFIITEWDITDGRLSGTLLTDTPRDLLIVGQALSWKRLDRSSDDLRRLFFTLRPNRNIGFNELPVAGLGAPASSLEAFRDWLNARAKEYPKLQVVHETNQGEWKSHLESCHLDPELFAYQLRMNLDEGGVNELFNELKETKDFVRLFLELGLDPEMPAKVRANLNEFLPQHRRLHAMRAQLTFNERLLVDLSLFRSQLAQLREAEGRLTQVTNQAASILAALNRAQEQASHDVTELQKQASEIDAKERALESQREGLRRRLKFFTFRTAEVAVRDAQGELQTAEEGLNEAAHRVRVVSLAELLSNILNLEAEALELQQTIEREQEHARPEREALSRLGGQYKAALNLELKRSEEHWNLAQERRRLSRKKYHENQTLRVQFERQQSAATAALDAVDKFFADRERQRERLRTDRFLEPKEESSAALARWRTMSSKHVESAARAKSERDAAIEELNLLLEQRSSITKEISGLNSQVPQIMARIKDAEDRETEIATHPEMASAIEAPRADLDLATTAERLQQRIVALLNKLLRCNVDMAEDERAEKCVERDGLFPASRDVEAVIEQLRAEGVASALPATHWLAANVNDQTTAANLALNDLSLFQGILFNPLVDVAKIDAAITAAKAPHAPVQVAPIPEQMPEPRALPASVVPPLHAGAYNRDAAQEQTKFLRERLEAARCNLDTLRGQYKIAAELGTRLSAWLREFGHGKLKTIREQCNGLQQSQASLHNRERSIVDEIDAKRQIAKKLEDQEKEHHQRQRDADIAATNIESFIRHFDAYFEMKRKEQEDHRQSYQAAEDELGTIAEAEREFNQKEPELERTENEARDSVRDLERERSVIEYASEVDDPSDEPLPNLRQRYRGEVLRFEGRFKDTAAQGQLTEKKNQIHRLRQRTSADEFRDVKIASAESLIAAGKLQIERIEAQQQHEDMKVVRTRSGVLLEQARNELGKLSKPSKDERPSQGELIPESAADLKAKVEELQASSVDLEGQFLRIREKKSEVEHSLTEGRGRAERFSSLAKILINLDIVPADCDLQLVDDETESTVDKLCTGLRGARYQTEKEGNLLAERYGDIQKLVQSEEFSRDVAIPARTLFASLSLPELVQAKVAEEREHAVHEQTLTLKAELEQMQKHRDLIVRELLTEAEKAMSLLRRTERLSKLPDSTGEWSGEPFLRIHLHGPHNEEEKVLRLQAYVEDLLGNGNVPDGVRLVFNALVALITDKGMDATILKPETQRRRQRYSVREMSGWSEGERTTVAIILYCTLVKLRTQSRGIGDHAEVSTLLLDNPIGKASKPEFLEMHRWIAGALGVQLIYATGINDPQALSVFPNRIRLAKNRIIPQTRELAVTVVPEDTDLVVNDIRIFDSADDRVQSRQTTEP
jgi:hypothetical protein